MEETLDPPNTAIQAGKRKRQPQDEGAEKVKSASNTDQEWPSNGSKGRVETVDQYGQRRAERVQFGDDTAGTRQLDCPPRARHPSKLAEAAAPLLNTNRVVAFNEEQVDLLDKEAAADAAIDRLRAWWRAREDTDEDTLVMLAALPNIAKMLEYRGYDSAGFPRTAKQLRAALSRGTPQCYARRDDPDSLISVMLMPGSAGALGPAAGGTPGAPRVAPKVGVDVTRIIQDWAEARPGPRVSRCVLISMAGMTPAAKAQLDGLEPNMRIESMCYSAFGYCPVEHRLVPKHRLLQPDEVAALLARFQVTLDQLPQQTRTDPISVYYGLKPGDVMLYSRCDGTQEPVDSVRVVS